MLAYRPNLLVASDLSGQLFCKVQVVEQSDSSVRLYFDSKRIVDDTWRDHNVHAIDDVVHRSVRDRYNRLYNCIHHKQDYQIQLV